MKVTPKTFRQLMAVLTQHGMQGRRHAIVWEASGHRTESSKELTEVEALTIIRHFNAKANRVRRKMIAIAGKMKWGATSSQIITALSTWTENRTAYKKPLMQLTMEELTKVATILETKVYVDYLKGIRK